MKDEASCSALYLLDVVYVSITLVRSSLEYGANVWDPYLIKDIDRLEKVQRKGARFIAKDYRSREPGCVTRMLQQFELPTLQTRRHQARLKMMYRVVVGLVTALSLDSFLKRAKQNKRRIKPKTFTDCVTENIIERQVINNNKGLVLPESNKEQFSNSFFVRTALDWNQLPDSIVDAPSADAFASSVGTHFASA